jgi:zinc transport system substrate-binding protein
MRVILIPQKARSVRRLALVMALAIPIALVPLSAAPAAAAAKRHIVASFYPLAYAAQRVGGDRVQVANLTPAGAEPHDLELTPDQIDAVLDADLVLTLGRNFQPAVEKAASQRDGPTLALLDRLRLVKRGDPHVWLDPVLMGDIVTQVQHALAKADPSGRATYKRNADKLRAELDALDTRYEKGLANCARKLIVTSHEAFGYLARRYGLKQEGVSGLSPDSEPDPKRLAALTDLVKREHVTVVFAEELVSPRIAQTLAREAGVKVDTLDPLEGLTGSEQRKGASYISVMDDNLAKLRAALACT